MNAKCFAFMGMLLLVGLAIASLAKYLFSRSR